LGDRFRLVANEIEVVNPPKPLPRLPVARAVWRPTPDLRTSTEAWLTAGGPHHTVLSTDIGTEELTDLADMTGTELLMIDACRLAVESVGADQRDDREDEPGGPQQERQHQRKDRDAVVVLPHGLAQGPVQ